MKEWGNHGGYKYAHDWPGAVAPQEYMPEELRGTEYYHPNDRGYEHRSQPASCQDSPDVAWRGTRTEMNIGE